MLGQRRRRWANIQPTLFQCIVCYEQAACDVCGHLYISMIREGIGKNEHGCESNKPKIMIQYWADVSYFYTTVNLRRSNIKVVTTGHQMAIDPSMAM